jgi:hypothetical protein
VARELEAAHEEDSPLAQLRPGLLDERPPSAADEGQLGEARVGVRHEVEQRHVVLGGERAQAVHGGDGRRKDGVLDADALGAAELQHLPMHVHQMAARERVEEAQARA